MSVMIKGMEMPRGCNVCQLRDLCFDYCVCRAKKLDDGRYLDVDDVVGRRHRCCPLVDIPTPHGRLIDADELIKKLERHRDMCGDIETQYGIDTAIRILRNIPTIIEAEVSE